MFKLYSNSAMGIDVLGSVDFTKAPCAKPPPKPEDATNNALHWLTSDDTKIERWQFPLDANPLLNRMARYNYGRILFLQQYQIIQNNGSSSSTISGIEFFPQ
jgi:hypothetical protein